MTEHADASFHVPDGEEPHRCPYCGRPFRTERLRALHVGETHERATQAEREAYAAAVDEESDDLFVYHMTVIGALVLLFFGFVYLYAFVLV